MDDLDMLISSDIKKKWGDDVPILKISLENLTQIIHNNSFTKTKDPQLLSISFLKNDPLISNFEKIERKKRGIEEFYVSNMAVFFIMPKRLWTNQTNQ